MSFLMSSLAKSLSNCLSVINTWTWSQPPALAKETLPALLLSASTMTCRAWLAEGPDKAPRSVDQRVPEAWHEDSASAERMAMVAEAFTRTLEAYREEDPVQACA